MHGRRRKAAPTSSRSSPKCSGGAANRPRRRSSARARPERLMSNLTRALLLLTLIPCAGAQAQLFRDTPRGEAVEHQLPGDRTFTQWARDPAALQVQGGDRVEMREVSAEKLETVKLANL